MLNWIVWNRTICIKMNLALNNIQRLIYHKTQTTKQPIKREKSLSWSDYKLIEQPWAYSLPTRCTNMDEKPTPTSHHGVKEGQQVWWQYVSIHLPIRHQTQLWGLHQVIGGGSTTWIERVTSWRPSAWEEDSVPCCTSRRKPRLGGEKISATTATSGHLTLPIVIAVIIMCGARFSKKPIKLCFFFFFFVF